MIGKVQTDVTKAFITEGQPQPEQRARVSEHPQPKRFRTEFSNRN
jgi:hypothetical protein